MGNPHDTLKRRSPWSIGLRWLGVLVILTLFAGAMIPLVLKPRKRSRATSILEEMRLIDRANDQYSIENGLSDSSTPTWSDVKLYLKVGTRLYNQATELNSYDDPTTAPKTPNTVDSFTEVIDDPAAFWGSFN